MDEVCLRKYICYLSFVLVCLVSDEPRNMARWIKRRIASGPMPSTVSLEFGVADSNGIWSSIGFLPKSLSRTSKPTLAQAYQACLVVQLHLLGGQILPPPFLILFGNTYLSGFLFIALSLIKLSLAVATYIHVVSKLAWVPPPPGQLLAKYDREKHVALQNPTGANAHAHIHT